MNEYAECVLSRRVRFPSGAVSLRTEKPLSHGGGSFCRGVFVAFRHAGQKSLRSHDHKRQLISQGGRAADQSVLPHPAKNTLPLVAEGFAKRRNPELVNKAAGPPTNRCCRTRLKTRSRWSLKALPREEILS